MPHHLYNENRREKVWGGGEGEKGKWQGKKAGFEKYSLTLLQKNPDVKYRQTVLNKNCTSPLGTSIIN